MEEHTLIELAVKGDNHAFEQLVLRYEKQVYHLALRMTGDRDEAFDLTQEIFIKVWRAISLFQNDCKFSTWLFRIGSNTCIDYLRRQKRKRIISLTRIDDIEDNSEMEISDNSLDPAIIAERMQDQTVVMEALQRLPEVYRVALSLRVIEDMSYEEIGIALDLKPGTVKSRIARAREKMRQALSGNFSEFRSSKSKKGGAGNAGL